MTEVLVRPQNGVRRPGRDVYLWVARELLSWTQRRVRDKLPVLRVGRRDVLRRRRMVCRHGVARPLPRHTIPASVRRRHSLLKHWVGEMRWPYLGTSVMRPWRGEWWLRRWNADHRAAAGNKGLRLGVEIMISVVAPWDGVLALGVMRIGICGKLAECVRNTTWTMQYS